MARPKKHKALRIILLSLLVIISIPLLYALYLTYHYKGLLKKELPAMVEKSSDGLYHISFSDISVNVFKKWVTVTDVKLWADSNRANELRRLGKYSPNTMSWVSAPLIEVSGIKWDNILSSHSFDCDLLVVHHAKWFMQTIKHEPDLSNIEEPKKPAIVTRMDVALFKILDPDVTYHFVGKTNTYYAFLKGGEANLYDWSVDRDISKDTSVFLYARHGAVLPKEFRLEKDDKIYTARNPKIGFSSTPTTVTLENVDIDHLTDVTKKGGVPLETYNCRFPAIEFVDFNWKRLLHNDVLIASAINAHAPYINVHYIRANFTSKDKTGSFPNQVIREFIKTYVKTLAVKGGKFVYNEPNDKNEVGVFQFDDINGTFSNITNIDSLIARNSSCVVKLSAKFMNKSPVNATFDLSLSDPKGHFSVTGSVSDLDGSDVSKQAADFTVAQVTSFHLSHMDGRVVGDESYANGQFTMRYSDLKISLFKFKSDERKNANGPFAFLADATVLFPSNPMPGKGLRSVSTHLPRDPHNGFMYLIWQNVYLGAQKTAVRDEKFLLLAGSNGAKADHKVSDEEQDKNKNGFFHRLLHGKLFKKKK